MLTQEKKKEIIENFGESDRDTGSAKVQVALLTARIADLTEHFREHKKDHCSRRGLMKMVGSRRRLLNYIKNNNVHEYRKLLKELNLRK